MIEDDIDEDVCVGCVKHILVAVLDHKEALPREWPTSEKPGIIRQRNVAAMVYDRNEVMTDDRQLIVGLHLIEPAYRRGTVASGNASEFPAM